MKRKHLVSKSHIKKGDIVVAIAGDDAAGKKTGKILQVFPAQGKALVEGLNFVKKTLRKSQDNPQGGVVDKEAPLDMSNLKLYNAATDAKPKKKSSSAKGAKK